MTVMVAAVVLGVVGGLLAGGRLGGLAEMRMRAWLLLGAALVAQAVLGHLPGVARWPLAVADAAAVGVWCLRNRGGGRGRVGFALVAGGVALNATAMAANAGMPVSLSALVKAGFSPTMNVAHGHFYKHVAMTGATRLRVLGDIIPIRLLHTVVSPGDVVMLVGIAAIAWGATLRAPRVAPTPRSTGTFGQSNTPLVAQMATGESSLLAWRVEEGPEGGQRQMGV
jgi:hypothetical protein